MHSDTFRRYVGRFFRRVFERFTGWHVLTTLPHGISLSGDLRTAIPTLDICTVFDVGANVGNSTAKFLEAFTNATVYSFEPVSSTFRQLQERFAAEHRVKCFAFGFGSRAAHAEMVLAGTSDRFALREHSHSTLAADIATEDVSLQTIDEFCSQQALEHIDFLKIDTEGHDLDVLRGADQMLREQRISLVQVEVGLSPFNRLHVPLEQVKNFFEERSYCVFGFYGQVAEWPLKSPILRRVDAVFLLSDEIGQPAIRKPS